MIFSGPIFAQLRSKALAFYPEDVTVPCGRRHSCAEWIRTGSYNVLRSDRNQFFLAASPTDLTVPFLSELELFQDHVFEQFGEVEQFAESASGRSAAWGVVTLYYYGFFAAHVAVRLFGQPVVYLDKDALAPIKQLTSGAPFPGAGVFRVRERVKVTPTSSEYEFRRLDLRSHNAVWATLFQIIRDETTAGIQTGGANGTEQLLFESLSSRVLFSVYVNDEWPAKIRHRANYSPGYWYRLVSKSSSEKLGKVLRPWRNLTAEQIALHLSSSVTLNKGTSEDAFENHIRLLNDTAHGIVRLARELYVDLRDRRPFDKRWEQRRSTFANRQPSFKNYSSILKI